ncbi:MAG: ribonuclease [Betaproteobacteria bacterium]|nr:ribonuclease [Betaproteobacteria bacterium]
MPSRRRVSATVAALCLLLAAIWVLSPAREQPLPELPAIAATALPREARDTLALVRAGGPFPYSRDGIVFSNRERLLPKQPRGYYHEYTVRTPGRRDRGPRRIVAGRPGEYYWTPDHYRHFYRIRE